MTIALPDAIRRYCIKCKAEIDAKRARCSRWLAI